MELHRPAGWLSPGWQQWEVERNLSANSIDWGRFYSTSGDAVWVVYPQRYEVGAGWIVGGHGLEPVWAILRVVGGGSYLGYSWSVWVTCNWDNRENMLSAEEIASLDARADVLKRAIAAYEAAYAQNPNGIFRPGIEEWRRELAEIQARLADQGNYQLVIYAGYAKRWGANQYVLKG